MAEELGSGVGVGAGVELQVSAFWGTTAGLVFS
jgi:hypothetical protein